MISYACRKMRRWYDIVIPALLLIGAVLLRVPALGVSDSAPMLKLRNLVFDEYQRQWPRPYRPDLPVRIVDVDEESLRRFGQWPWPRTLFARIVDRLAEADAGVVAFDIVFAEPDRTAPANFLSTWEDYLESDRLRSELEQLPDPDILLSSSMAKTRTVTAFALRQEPGLRKPAKKWGDGAVLGDDPRDFVKNFAGALTTQPVLEAGAQGNGSVNYIPDPDNIVRRAGLFYGLEGELYPSLAAEAIRLASDAPSYDYSSSGASGIFAFGEHTGIVQVRLGQPIVPTDDDGAIRLYDTGHQPRRFIPAWQVLDGSFDAGMVSGHIVLIGSSAIAVKDVIATPLEPVMAGVETHAQVIEQILSGQFLQRPDWISGAEILYLIAVGVVLLFAIRRAGALWSLVIVLGAAGAAIGISVLGFRQAGLLIDPLYPCLVALLLYVSGTYLGYRRTEREKRVVRNIMSRYLAPALVTQLERHPERLKLGGDLRELTVLFSDIRGFTQIAEQLDPEALTRLVNRFLTPLTRIIQKSRGTVDKYMGDCVMAFWNAPLDVRDHGREAVAAALAIRDELHRLNEDLKVEGARDGVEPIVLAAGIGLNSGRARVGNMGSEQRLAYSAIGDTVNIASRLEGLSRVYGVDIVLGEETARQAAGFALLELDLVRVKGRDAPLRVYTVLGDGRVTITHHFDMLSKHHDAMLAAYRSRNWTAAREALLACRPIEASLVGLYDLYERRIARYERTPPPEDWDGVFTATTKQG
jgi:adenylate cyclase